jgi:tetratricopeptide (TPR) repeat protein
MQYQEYITRTTQIKHLMDTSRLKEAVVALYKLFLSDVSDIDKVRICADMAAVYDRMGDTDEALSWYDKGIALEQTYSRFEVTEKKAQYLSQIGRSQAAVPIYENLMKQAYIGEVDRERMRRTVQTMLGKTMAEWK